MKYIPEMIMVGSNAKNSGKTWLCTYLIEKFSKEFNVIGIKAKSLAGNDKPHFNEDIIEQNGFDIFEEKDFLSKSDTSKMLQAGAKRSFFVQTKVEFIAEAVEKLTSFFEEDSVIVCESNNLINHADPSLFLLCTSDNPTNVKSSYEELLKRADAVLKSDGTKFDFDIERIYFDNGNKKWKIKDK